MKTFCTALSIAILTMAAPAIAHDERPKASKSMPKIAPKPAASLNGLQAPQHSGGTDSKGCHTNHSTGEYHCHKPK